MTTPLLALGLAAGLGLAAAAPGRGAVPPPEPPRPAGRQANGWAIQRSPAAEAWFHALALVGVRGIGPFPLYDAAYAGRARAARPAGTALDRAAPALLGAIQADSAFEILHFVPMYFAGSSTAALLSAVRHVAAGGDREAAALPATERFGAAVLRQSLPTAAQRRVLGRLADAIEAEPAPEPPALADLAAADSAWRALIPALDADLRRWRVAAGRLVAVPALGPDGRLFQGVPGRDGDNVLAVGLEPGRAADLPYRAVRELCYPAVRQAMGAAGAPPDRIAAERLSGVAAVRCGAMWLARAAPGHAAAYRAAWQRLAGRPGDFASAFPLPDALVRALDTALGR